MNAQESTNINDLIRQCPLFAGSLGKILTSYALRSITIDRIEDEFTKRFENILRKLTYIQTLEDLINTSHETFIKAPNCGRKTIEDVKKTVLRLIEDLPELKDMDLRKTEADTQRKPEKRDMHPPDSYELFYGRETVIYINIPPNILELKLIEIDFPVRFKKYLTAHKEIITVRQLLNVSPKILSKFSGINKGTIAKVQNIILNLAKNMLPHENTSSQLSQITALDKLIFERIKDRISNARNFEIILARLSFAKEHPFTLEALGQKLKLTRERISQIEEDCLEDIRYYPNIFSDIEEFLQQGYYIYTLDYLEADLLEKKLWSGENKSFLRELLKGPLKDREIVYIEGDYFFTIEPSRLNQAFPIIRDNLIELIGNNEEGIPINLALSYLNEKCNFGDISKQRILSNSAIFYIAENSKKFGIHDDKLYNEKIYNLYYGKGLEKVAYWALKHLGERVHFTQLAEYIRTNNGHYRNTSDATVHSVLINSKRILNTNRGVYALNELNFKHHLTVGEALLNLLAEKGPLLVDSIYDELSKKYSVWNIKMALENNRHKLIQIGNDMYDLGVQHE